VGLRIGPVIVAILSRRFDGDYRRSRRLRRPSSGLTDLKQSFQRRFNILPKRSGGADSREPVRPAASSNVHRGDLIALMHACTSVAIAVCDRLAAC
jgi:hypothetical protein